MSSRRSLDRFRSAAAWLLLAGAIAAPGAAIAAVADDDDDDDKPASTVPNIYLDLRTGYASLPTGAGIGFGGMPLLTNLAALANAPSLTQQAVSLDLPITLDLNDRLSVYGGVTTLASRTDLTPWSSMSADSLSFGLQADVLQQNGGPLPTLTVQATLTRSLSQAPLATTQFTGLAEAGYALDADETRGWLAGFRAVTVSVDSPLASVAPTYAGWIGAYYQWDSNWKLSGRVGVQSFAGGALTGPLGRSVELAGYTRPLTKLDLDLMDDNDNRLFGVSAEVLWTARPAVQLTVRTPLYAVRN
jgi:hypothetical protein